MSDNYSAAPRIDTADSEIERTEQTAPFGGCPNGSEMRFASNGNLQRKAVRSLIASRVSSREGCPAKGRFLLRGKT